jgi:hypothetical protein
MAQRLTVNRIKFKLEKHLFLAAIAVPNRDRRHGIFFRPSI